MNNKLLSALVATTLQLAAAAAFAQQATPDQCPIVGTATSSSGATAVRTGPMNPVDGFPEYVTDINGVSVQRCLDPLVCFFDPIVPTDPFSLQINSGGEAFYWDASTLINDPAGNRLLTIVMAAESAFLQAGPNNEPINGSQFPFLRLRFVLNAPLNAQGVAIDGTYTVKHPYGTEVFTVVGATGARDVFSTVEKGLAPSAELTGPVGPFLIATTRPAGFLGDANGLPTTVTGSPCGRNFVELSGVDTLGQPIDFGGGAKVLRANTFTVQGQLYDGRTQTPLAPTRMTYSRSTDGTGQIETFADSTATAAVTANDGPTTPTAAARYRGVTPLQSAAVPAGHGIDSLVLPVVDASTLPPVVQLRATDATAATATDATALNLSLVDFVDVKSADYDANTKTLVVTARTADRLGNPKLSLRGFGDFAPGSDTYTINNLVAPPASVAVDSVGGGSDSAPVMIKLVSILAAPSALEVDAARTTSRTLALSWIDNANSETGYRIYATPAGGAQRLVGTTSANISSATITGLDPATTYTIVVEAYGPSAVAASDPYLVTTLALPLAPSTASAVMSSATQRAIDVTWAASQDPDVTGYAVYRSDNLATPLAGASNLAVSARSFRDTASPVGASVSYKVVALRARAGVTDASTPASSLTLVTPSLPAAPTALAASVVNQTVTLRWSASATATAQQVYRQSGTGAFVAVGAPLAASATSFTDENLVGASYTYRVDASNWAGTTASSVSSSVNVVSLGAATAITATANASNQPVLSWTDNAGGESGYQIRRRAYTISATNGAMTVGAWSTLTAAAAVTGVGSKGSYTDTTAVANTTYMYELAPLNATVVGTVANSPHALALNGGLPRMGAINSTTASVVGTAGQVVLTWTASTNASVAGYEITRCNSVVLPILGATQVCSNAQVKLGNAVNSGGTVDGRNTVTFTDTTVARNTSYVYNIRLLGGAGTGIAGPQLVLGKTASVR